MKLFNELDIKLLKFRSGSIGCPFMGTSGKCIDQCGILFPKLYVEKYKYECPCTAGIIFIVFDEEYLLISASRPADTMKKLAARKLYIKKRFWTLLEKHHPRGDNR